MSKSKPPKSKPGGVCSGSGQLIEEYRTGGKKGLTRSVRCGACGGTGTKQG